MYGSNVCNNIANESIINDSIQYIKMGHFKRLEAFSEKWYYLFSPQNVFLPTLYHFPSVLCVLYILFCNCYLYFIFNLGVGDRHTVEAIQGSWSGHPLHLQVDHTCIFYLIKKKVSNSSLHSYRCVLGHSSKIYHIHIRPGMLEKILES